MDSFISAANVLNYVHDFLKLLTDSQVCHGARVIRILCTSISLARLKGHNFGAFKCCSFRYKSVAFAESDCSCVFSD